MSLHKRIISLSLVLVLFFFSGFGTPACAAAETRYDPQKAVDFAAENWNVDLHELCAEFVWKCVEAGGLPLNKEGLYESFRITTGCAQGICNAIGRPYNGVKNLDNVVLASDGSAYTYGNPRLNAGDIVFQYCTTCGLTPHVLICSGFNEWGAAKFYAHNPATNDYAANLTLSGIHKGSSCNVVAKFIDMPGTNKSCACRYFEDVATSAWYHADIDYMVGKGYMNGVSSYQFSPNGTTTRAMLAALLYRISGSPSAEGLANPFDDVAPGLWYTDAILWARSAGVMMGVTETHFSVNGALTREQLMVALYRYAAYCKVSPDTTLGADRWPQLTDRDEISPWALEGVQWGVSCGIVKGDPALCINPTSTATRAEFAALMHRYLEMSTT